MKKLLPFLLATLIVGLFTLPAVAQRPTRIAFKRGARSAVVSGTMSSYRSARTYVIRVRKGQRLTTEPIGETNPVSIWITSPDGSSFGDDLDLSCHSRREVFPAARGDYILKVQECQKADPWRGRFRFRVTVR
ncbi:MAG: hypothetical protein KBD94_12140 [Pyrinomonadaceae bacterium]|nr:hypothetical protein [Pyrinomonadaceae bacterium]